MRRGFLQEDEATMPLFVKKTISESNSKNVSL